jgi:hypothetical protein
VSGPSADDRSGPLVPVGGGVPVDPETGERYGYLPRKAAQRKLVIRAQLGQRWVVGSLLAGLGILLLVGGFLLSRPDRPGAPFVDQGPLRRYEEGGVTALTDESGWLDRRAGLRAVVSPVAYCPADGGWVDDEGRRYGPDGRAVDGGRGLELARVRVASGRVYVDPTSVTTVRGQAPALGTCDAPQAPGEPPPPDGL